MRKLQALSKLVKLGGQQVIDNLLVRVFDAPKAAGNMPVRERALTYMAVAKHGKLEQIDNLYKLVGGTSARRRGAGATK